MVARSLPTAVTTEGMASFVPIVPWIVLTIVAGLAGTASAATAVDAQVYYSVAFPPSYEGSTALISSYNYSPAFAFWVQPLQLIPFEAFRAAVAVGSIVALGYLVGPWAALILVAFQMPTIANELTVGNINLIVGATVVLAFRYPGLLAMPMLTKVTPGVGVLWYAVRREWRPLWIAVSVTLALTVPSLILAPPAWVEWGRLLLANDQLVSGMLVVPVAVRLAVAVALTVYAAKSGRPWVVPFAAALVGPQNAGTWLIALGAWRLYGERRVQPI